VVLFSLVTVPPALHSEHGYLSLRGILQPRYVFVIWWVQLRHVCFDVGPYVVFGYASRSDESPFFGPPCLLGIRVSQDPVRSAGIMGGSSEGGRCEPDFPFLTKN